LQFTYTICFSEKPHLPNQSRRGSSGNTAIPGAPRRPSGAGLLSEAEMLPTKYPLPVFNVVAYPKLQRSDQLMPVFRGDMYKKGQSIPYSWKKRTFQLTGRKLKYFDKGSYKGEFDIKNCLVFHANLENGGPANCFQFTLVSSILKDNTMECCTCTEYDRQCWINVITTQSRLLATTIFCCCPPAKAGYLRKKGHIVTNWKTR
jgi:hypothetical protein